MATESLVLPPVVASLVDGHVFTHAAELVLPWPSPPAPAPAVPQSSAWRVCGPLSALLDPGFVERHAQRGELRALTLTALDQGGAVAIVPRSQLLIVCDTPMYQRLGLEGLPAAAAPKGSHFCVRVDLLEACRDPDTHARLLRAAQLVGPVQLLLLWELDGEPAEPTFPDGVKVSRVDCEASRQAFAALRVPELAALADDEPTVADAPSAAAPEAAAAERGDRIFFGDWTENGDGDGDDDATRPARPSARRRPIARSCSSSCSCGSASWRAARAASSTTPPPPPTPRRPTAAASRRCSARCRWPRRPPPAPCARRRAGAGCCRRARCARCSATRWASSRAAALPWAALTAWGFADAPVSFGLTEHDHAPSGAEHDLVLVVQPGRIVLSFCLGAADRFQPERLRSGGVRHLY